MLTPFGYFCFKKNKHCSFDWMIQINASLYMSECQLFAGACFSIEFAIAAFFYFLGALFLLDYAAFSACFLTKNNARI
ncbi:MAG: hypothetical protein IPO35_17815 [Uliginosibacterium sp.]|nr:hypothetical protein [Uliginosibacterium sp.]